MCCFVIAISSWLILFRFFEFKTKEEVERMRQMPNLKDSEQAYASLKHTMDSDMKTTLKTGKFGGNSENTTSYANNNTESFRETRD